MVEMESGLNLPFGVVLPLVHCGPDDRRLVWRQRACKRSTGGRASDTPVARILERKTSCTWQRVIEKMPHARTVEVSASCYQVCPSPACFSFNLFMRC